MAILSHETTHAATEWKENIVKQEYIVTNNQKKKTNIRITDEQT